MRLKVLAEIYTIHSFAQLCNFNFSSKFVKNSANNYWQNCQTDRADVNLRKSETRTEVMALFPPAFDTRSFLHSNKPEEFNRHNAMRNGPI